MRPLCWLLSPLDSFFAPKGETQMATIIDIKTRNHIESTPDSLWLLSDQARALEAMVAEDERRVQATVDITPMDTFAQAFAMKAECFRAEGDQAGASLWAKAAQSLLDLLNEDDEIALRV
jgi:hypothetical protein